MNLKAGLPAATAVFAVFLFSVGPAGGVTRRHDLNPEPADTNPRSTTPGGRFVAVAIDPTNNKRAWALSDNGGVFGTRDGGDQWEGNVRANGSTGDFGRGLDDGIVGFADLAVDPKNPKNLVLLASGDERGLADSHDGAWFSSDDGTTDAGTTWQHAVDGMPPCSMITGAKLRVVFAPATKGLVIASTPCRLGVSTDSGRTWTWRSPVPSAPNVPIDGLDFSIDNGGAERVVFCAGAGGDAGVGLLRLSAANAIMAPRPPAASGTSCSVAADPLWSDRIFLAVGDPSSVWEGIRSASGTISWTDLLAPSFGIGERKNNNRPPFVQVHRNGTGIRVYFHDSTRVWSEDCVDRSPCPLGPGPAPAQTECPAFPWRCVDLGHADVGGIAFDPAQLSTACPLLIATDGGVSRDADCGALPPNGPVTGGDASTATSGLHALHVNELAGTRLATGFSLATGFLLGAATWDTGVLTRLLGASGGWLNDLCGDGLTFDAFAGTSYQVCNGAFKYFPTGDTAATPPPPAPPGTPVTLWGPGGRPSVVAPKRLLTASLTAGGAVQLYEYDGTAWIPNGPPTPPSLGTFVNGPGAGDFSVAIPQVGPTGLRSAFVIVARTATGTRALLCRSSNGGTWRESALSDASRVFASPGEGDFAFAYDRATNDIYISRDTQKCDWTVDATATKLATANGAFTTWNEFAWRGPGSITTVGFDPLRPGRALLATLHNGVLVTNDYGANWRVSHAYPEPNNGIRGFAFTDTGIATGTVEETIAGSWGRGIWSADFEKIAYVRAAIDARSVVLDQTELRVAVHCPRNVAAACNGWLSIPKANASSFAGAHASALARAPFIVPRARTKAIRLRLSASGQVRLKRARAVTLIVATRSQGTVVRSRQTLRLTVRRR